MFSIITKVVHPYQMYNYFVYSHSNGLLLLLKFLCIAIATKEDIGIEQQLYEIVMGKNFALNCLS